MRYPADVPEEHGSHHHRVVRRAFQYRLYPTRPQLQDLDRTLTLCRQLYNAALQERRDAYRKAGKTVGFYQQKRYLPEIRTEHPEYKGIHSQVLQNVIERVDLAFRGFFRRVRAGQKAGYPRFQGQRRYDSFTFPQAGQTGVKVQIGRVLLYGIGSVRCRFHRPLEGRLKTATVRREGEDRYIVFSCEVAPQPLPERQEAIGIDLGTNPHFLLTSDGERIEAPRYFQKAQARLAAAQRSLARKQQGSKRRQEARRQLARLHRKVANPRRDFHHKLARRLVNRYGTIVHEDLNILGLARSRTARGVLDAGWAQFLTMATVLRKEVELGTGGRLVIPREMREALELSPGDRLVLTLREGHLELIPRSARVRELQGILARPDGRNLTAELLAERREEAEGKGR